MSGEEPPRPAETILLVDDDPEVLSLAADILRAAGYAVLSTHGIIRRA